MKGMTQVVGSSELPILLSGSRLAYLIMVKAHEEGHRASKSTLWMSRAQAWIVGGRRLAARVDHSCIYCRRKRGVRTAQQMGDLAVERILPGCKPFKAICLDFMGSVTVKASKMALKHTLIKMLSGDDPNPSHGELCAVLAMAANVGSKQPVPWGLAQVTTSSPSP